MTLDPYSIDQVDIWILPSAELEELTAQTSAAIVNDPDEASKDRLTQTLIALDEEMIERDQWFYS